MNQIKLHHIALSYPDEKKAEIFFGKILGLQKEKEFFLFAGFAKKIFGTDQKIKIKIYSNNQIVFEIFIIKERSKFIYNHICLTVPSKKKIISSCKVNRIKVINIEDNGKKILFIKDFYNYLYEIKEDKK